MSNAPNEKPAVEAAELPGIRKAAILLLAMDQDTSAELLKRLPGQKIEDITREIATSSEISPEARVKIVREFYNVALARQFAGSGGLPIARALLERTLPRDEAQRVIDSLQDQVQSQPFNFLQDTEAETLLTFLHGEHPQTIALVLSHLSPAMAAEILVGLEAERQIEVITRIAGMDQTSPDVIKEVEQGLEKRLSGMVSERSERAGGVGAVAEMLNLAGRAAEKSIMEGLTEDNADLVEDIRRLMFVFEDIMRVDDKGIQGVLKEVENDELSLALRTASDELKEKIFKNMSERAAELIKEEMEYMGPVRVSDVEAAQQKIVDTVRRLEESGDIIIAGRGGEKDMVV